MASELQFKNVKAVLFGNQKQANAINDAVVTLVTEELLSYPGGNLDSEDGVIACITDVINEMIDAGLNSTNRMFLLLTTGPNSVHVLEEHGPLRLDVTQPSDQSPKHNFRIVPMGYVAPEVKVHEMAPAAKPAATVDEVLDPTDSFAEQARKLKDAILPTVPGPIKDEVSDEYAQALLCAQSYFEYSQR